MTGHELRDRFLRYFERHGHTVVRSSPLVPANDPTLLFTNAGMVQFKDVFLGEERRDYVRATTCQKCVRAGGKHNDLENVGFTARHHTFFEMLGNFSFGDYFKTEAIAYAWEFLTRDLGLPPGRLCATVFTDDDEAFDLWKALSCPQRPDPPPRREGQLLGDGGHRALRAVLGDPLPPGRPPAVRRGGGRAPVPRARLRVRPVAGDLEPGVHAVRARRDGPPDAAAASRPSTPAWASSASPPSSRASPRTTTPTCSAPLIADVERRSGKAYGAREADDVSMRVIADHARATAFLIADGVLPSNEGRGYVLRRIMRRAMRHGRLLGLMSRSSGRWRGPSPS